MTGQHEPLWKPEVKSGAIKMQVNISNTNAAQIMLLVQQSARRRLFMQSTILQRFIN